MSGGSGCSSYFDYLLLCVVVTRLWLIVPDVFASANVWFCGCFGYFTRKFVDFVAIVCYVAILNSCFVAVYMFDCLTYCLLMVRFLCVWI